MQTMGTSKGYLPDPTKIILVVAPSNAARAEEFFCRMGLQVVKRIWYLGWFIGDGAAETRWLTGKVEVWAESVGTLAGVSCKHRQSTYAGLHKSLQQEWEFLQLVIPGIGDAFSPVEKALQETFLLEILEKIGRGGTRERGHPPVSGTGRIGPSGPNADGP